MKVCLAMVFALLGGCNRIIVVPHGKAVMVMEDVNCLIGTKDTDGKIVVGEGRIPAGWIAAPLLLEGSDNATHSRH